MTRTAMTMRIFVFAAFGAVLSLAVHAQTTDHPPTAASAPAQASTAAIPVSPAATTRNALAPQAAATRVASCTNITNNLLAALDKGDYAGAEMDFNDAMRAGLNPAQLKAAWESLPAKFGQPGPRGAPRNSSSEGYTVITVPMPFQNGNLAAQVACATDGKVAGFHVMTAPSAPAAPVTSSSGG